MHQPDHLRGDELRVPTGVQKPVDVQELAGTAAEPQGCDKKAVRSLNSRARFSLHLVALSLQRKKKKKFFK